MPIFGNKLSSFRLGRDSRGLGFRDAASEVSADLLEQEATVLDLLVVARINWRRYRVRAQFRHYPSQFRKRGIWGLSEVGRKGTILGVRDHIKTPINWAKVRNRGWTPRSKLPAMSLVGDVRDQRARSRN